LVGGGGELGKVVETPRLFSSDFLDLGHGLFLQASHKKLDMETLFAVLIIDNRDPDIDRLIML